MITNDTTTSTPKSADDICIPSVALAVDGTEPAEGDEVEFTVKGTVTSSADGRTHVKPSTVNGEPVDQPEEKPENPDDDMMAQAQAADANT